MQVINEHVVSPEDSHIAALANEYVISEVELTYSDNSVIGEGLCSCVCINDEQCCGCPAQ